MTIKERILLFIDYKGINKENFFSEMGISYANFKGKAKSSSLSSDTINKFSVKFPELNIEWLITGNGNMIKDNYDPTGMGRQINSDNNKSKQYMLNVSDNQKVSEPETKYADKHTNTVDNLVKNLSSLIENNTMLSQTVLNLSELLKKK